MNFLYAFICGGLLCIPAQLLIDKTKLTPARIVVIYVAGGVALTALGLYEPLVRWCGAGATVPLVGFGYALAGGVKEAVAAKGFLGAFTGGLSATAGGIAVAIALGCLLSLFFKPRGK